jgi:hypothetical protein
VFTTGWICRGDPVASDPCCSGGQDPVWGRSSAGRAPALQAGGHRFDPGRLHHPRLQSKRVNKHQPISATMVLPQRNNGSSRFVGMRPTHRNAGLLCKRRERRTPWLGVWLSAARAPLVILYRGMSPIRLDHGSGQSVPGMWSRRVCGRLGDRVCSLEM